VTRARLVVAVVLGPAVWLGCFMLLFSLVPWICRHPSVPARLLLPAIGLAAMGAAGVAVGLVWPVWRSTGMGAAGGSPVAGRTRFLALTGLGSGALFMLVGLAVTIPILMLGPCD
jgi:hypothetical protein